MLLAWAQLSEGAPSEEQFALLEQEVRAQSTTRSETCAGFGPFRLETDCRMGVRNEVSRAAAPSARPAARARQSGDRNGNGKIKPTLASLFSGIGGFDLGFEQAGFRVTYQCEIEPFCNRILDKFWPGIPRAQYQGRGARWIKHSCFRRLDRRIPVPGCLVGTNGAACRASRGTIWTLS